MSGIENMTDQSLPSASEPIRNIVLVGRTGNGKSATGNSIIGENVFVSEAQPTGVTMKCQIYTAVTPGGSRINVIDTPGLFDLSVSAEYLSKEIINCLSLAEGGLHAVLLVLSVKTRISQEEETTLRTLQVIFGSQIVDYLVVLFTGGDELEANDMTLDDYLSRGCPEFLKTVLRLCGGRRILFDNKTTNQDKKLKQVKDLLVHVADIEKHNGGNPFRDETLRKIEKETEMFMEQIKELETKKLPDADIQELKKQFEREHDQNMNTMALMLEELLRQSSERHERMLLELRDNLESSQIENETNENMHSKHCLNIYPQIRMEKGCNIL